MMKAHPNVSLLGLISYLVLAGCANDPYMSPPPTAEVRASLGRVTVQSSSSGTHADVEKPYTPGKAAAAGAMDAISGIDGGGGGDFGGVVIFLVPIAAVVGGTAGGMHGTPAAEAQAEWQVLSNACATLDFQKGLRRNVIMAMRKYTRVPVQTEASGVSGQRTADTLLELSVLQAGLTGQKYKNSPMTVFLKVQARLVRLSEGRELYKHIWIQTGRELTYGQWASRDARLFRQELSYLCGKVAVRMVREIFLVQSSTSWWESREQEDPWRSNANTYNCGFF